MSASTWKRVAAIATSLIMVVSLVPVPAFAAPPDPTGAQQPLVAAQPAMHDGQLATAADATYAELVNASVTTVCRSFDELAAKVSALGGSTYDIYMKSDWNVNRRLVIPPKAHVTLHMGGHIFDRGLARDNNWQSDGELIYVGDSASLAIEGDAVSTAHEVGVYTNTPTDNKATAKKTFTGGVLAGGCSTNGAGGIHLNANATLTLSNVTSAGCRAEQRIMTDGFGGGIRVAGNNATVNMVNSTITGCYAYDSGGGVFATSGVTDPVNVDFIISGQTAIRGNTDATGAKSNLTLESRSVRAMFRLVKGAEIGLGYKPGGNGGGSTESGDKPGGGSDDSSKGPGDSGYKDEQSDVRYAYVLGDTVHSFRDSANAKGSTLAKTGDNLSWMPIAIACGVSVLVLIGASIALRHRRGHDQE